MNLSVGKYFIMEHSYWSNTDYIMVIIEKLDLENKTVYYRYHPDEAERRRDFSDFRFIKLIPLTSLTEELL